MLSKRVLLCLAATSVLGGSIFYGCNGSPTVTPSSSGTGAFGVVTVHGKQFLYLPLKEISDGGGGQIAVVDVGLAAGGDAGVNALLTNIDLGTDDAGAPAQATTSAGDSTVVLAAGTQTYTVWFIDPTQNKVVGTLQLDPSLVASTFSGGSAIVTGIAMDEANHRAILSVWDGFLFVDLNSKTVTGSLLTAAAENAGFDGTRELLFAPFYNCGNGNAAFPDGGGPCAGYTADAGPITDGLNVVNLKTNAVYTYENPAAQNPSTPLGSEPDSAAVDTSSGVCVVPSEGDSYASFINMTQAVFDDTHKTFTAPTVQLPNNSYDGVAVESLTHLAFFEQEFENTVAVADMTQVVWDGGLAPAAVVQATLPSAPDGTGWANLGDPHGIAVTTGLSTNGPVGFVVTDTGSGPVWVARVDLKKMLQLGQTADAGGTLTADQLAPAITMLNATVAE